MAVLVTIAIVAAFTFRDYGLGWDDYTHSEYGDLLLSLYGSGFRDTRALSFVNLYLYGGGFDMAAALAAKILPFDLFETRRLIGAAVGIVGLLATWRLGRRLGGPLAGLCALVLLATCPLYYGHMFMNAKDAPFAAAMIVLLLGVVRAIDEHPQPGPRAIVLVGVGLGLAFGSRILAAIAAPSGMAALVLILIVESRSIGLRPAIQRLWQFVGLMLPALALAYLIMGLLWPWAIQSPLNPLFASEHFANFFEKPWRELFAGKLYSVPDMPVSYLPRLFALKLPEVMLALGIAGFGGALAMAARRSVPINRRAALLLVALSALVPIAVALVLHPAFYNGLRHFVFVVPPFAVLGGLAAGWIAAHARALARDKDALRAFGQPALAALAALFIGGVTLPAIDMVRLHPYQYTAFNWASGGVRTAHKNYMLDYWGLAFKQAANELRATLDARHETPPAGRRWIVETCGPQRGAEVALGPQFETTWERKPADFAMTLGTFYCRDLDAPTLVEIVREGVVYARVYDIRGRPVPHLLTEPPP
ncbi:MAG: glycosyltransferase family 39 protein [Rhizobiales bacterium]|nr:glycosyltransferase family 39 protein [Hyphomicrobiales bacterium]